MSEVQHSGRFWPRNLRIGDTVSWFQGNNLVYGLLEEISMPKGRLFVRGRKHALQVNRIISVSRNGKSVQP